MRRAFILAGALLGGLSCAPPSAQPPTETPASATATAPNPASEDQAATPEPLRLYFIDRGAEPFPEVIPGGGPWVVWSIVLVEERESGRFALPGGYEVSDGARVHVSELALDPDFIAPPEHLWLIGATQACAARIEGPARIAIYDDGATAATIAFELSGCPKAEWAPIGLTGDQAQASELRWHPASAPDPALPLDPQLSELRDAFAAEAETSHPEAAGRQIRVELSAAATNPAVVEVVYGALWPAPDPCDGGEALRSTIGTVKDGTIDALPCPEVLDGDCSGFWLQGALAIAGSPQVIVLMGDMFDAQVVIRSDARDVYRDVPRDSIEPIPSTLVYDEDRAQRHFVDAQICDDEL